MDWQSRNREKTNEISRVGRARRLADPIRRAAHNEKKKAWSRANKDKVSETNRKYRERNPEKNRIYGKTYYAQRSILDPNRVALLSEDRALDARIRVIGWVNAKGALEMGRRWIKKGAKDWRERNLVSLEKANRQLMELAMSFPTVADLAAANVSPKQAADFILQVKSMTTPELFAEFSACTVRVSEGLYRMAVVWTELENRGENLSIIKTPFRQFFPAIASGKLLPDVALEYGGAPKKIELFAKLVPEDQRKLLGDSVKVPVAVRGVDGKIETIEIAPIEMRLCEARQVFGDGHIRTPAEQEKFVPPAPVSPEPPKLSLTAKPEHFDIWSALSESQREELAALALRRGFTAAWFIIDLLERTKGITKAPRRAMSA